MSKESLPGCEGLQGIKWVFFVEDADDVDSGVLAPLR